VVVVGSCRHNRSQHSDECGAVRLEVRCLEPKVPDSYRALERKRRVDCGRRSATNRTVLQIIEYSDLRTMNAGERGKACDLSDEERTDDGRGSHANSYRSVLFSDDVRNPYHAIIFRLVDLTATQPP
jgi:hypothetical protein